MVLHLEEFAWFSSYLLAKEAESRGIKVTNPLKGAPLREARSHFLLLDYKGHKELVQGQRLGNMSAPASKVCDNKEATKFFLKQAGLSVPRGAVVRLDDIQTLKKNVQYIGYPLVVKPVDGAHGKNVFLKIDSFNSLLGVLKKFQKSVTNNAVLLEHYCTGSEYRFLATTKRCLAVTLRVPANIVGDGIHSIAELIHKKNQDPRRGEGDFNVLSQIKIDPEMKIYLRRQGFSLGYKPQAEEQIFLRQQSNISQGGDSIDVTDEVREEYKRLAVRAVCAIPGLPYAGVDMLVHDYKKLPTKKNYTILELNGSPGFSMHHVPFKGKGRDIARTLIDSIFPETKKKRNYSIKKIGKKFEGRNTNDEE